MEKVIVKDLVQCGDIAIKTGPFGTQLKASEYVQNGTPVLNVRNLGFGTVNRDKLESVGKDTLERLASHKLSTGDIVFGRKGAVERHAYISEKENGWMQGSDCIRLRVLSDKINSRYLSYYFLTSTHQSFMQSMCSHGTTMASLNQKIIEMITLPLPDKQTQDKIVSFLADIDDKIALNTAINKNLEAQARALFKAWFIDFEPFGGVMPDDWTSGVLGDFVEIKRGGSPRPIQEYLSDKGLRWLKISDATGITTPFILAIKEHIKESGLKKTVFLRAGALVLSNSATPGIPKILDVDSCIHDGWLYFPKSKLSNDFLYLLFLHIRKELVMLGNGSVFTNLKTDILKNYPFVLPSTQVLMGFDDFVHPIFSEILSLTRENKCLTELRDALLSKLMSGELDVSALDF